MKVLLSVLRFLLASAFAVFTAGVVVLVAAYFYIAPQLPDIESLKDVRLQVPLRVYTEQGQLIAEFGEQRRTPVTYDQLPETVIQAILATEDDRFFEHPGVDYQGILRAVIELIRTGQKTQGGSTITMQVARNFFLSREKTYLRKLTEIFLALKIERALSKEEILELYLNKIYFGQRAYGVAAAAQVYYGKRIDELSLAQIAMIAGLPKAPSSNNPVSNPERALERRNYVLGRMYALAFIDEQTYREAIEQPDDAYVHTATIEVEAPYVAEMVRAHMVHEFGDEAYNAGYRVLTTLDGQRQEAANKALRDDLLAYDRRHGYRGAEAKLELPEEADAAALEQALESIRSYGGLLPAVVVEVMDRSARIFIRGEGVAELEWDGMSWARPFRTVNLQGKAPEKAAQILARGDLVRVEAVEDDKWKLAQVPQLAGALVSVRPQDGALQALVGGFDFYRSKFNRATQAQRQPGSSFKPFVYSAALARGYTVASLFNDAPVVFDDASLEKTWRPENYSGKFFGPTRMREALTRSRNLVSIRLLRAIGPRYAARYVQRFGFEPDQIPRDLSLALGSGTATPWEMARAYSVLANGGFRVEPYFIAEIRDAGDEVLFQAQPAVACPQCEILAESGDDDSAVQVTVAESDGGEPVPEDDLQEYAERVLEPANVFLVTSMLRDVIRRGTGTRAMELGRRDLAGKTGTTNDQRDAWFCGYNADLVTTVWVGFDKVQPLGNGETGGRAALPMWVEYMRVALDGVAETPLEQPEELVTVRIDPVTGLRLQAGRSGGIYEFFRPDHVPERATSGTAELSVESETGEQGGSEPLF